MLKLSTQMRGSLLTFIHYPHFKYTLILFHDHFIYFHPHFKYTFISWSFHLFSPTLQIYTYFIHQIIHGNTLTQQITQTLALIIIAIMLNFTNMAVSSRDWKPSIKLSSKCARDNHFSLSSVTHTSNIYSFSKKIGSNCRIPGPPNVLLKKAANAVRSPKVDQWKEKC